MQVYSHTTSLTHKERIMSTDLRPVLVTGGAGYIGSHTVLELLETGKYQPVVVDNMDNSSAESILRIEKLTGKKVEFHQLDLLDLDRVREVFKKHNFCAVIHCAGLKAVGVSMGNPLKYYRVNLDIAIGLLEVMKEFGVKNVIFSSSSTVYGKPQKLPVDEQNPVGGCTNPYGRTKFFIEQIMKDVCVAEGDWNITLLRYFNPVGAHKSGEIGEDPRGVPKNVMPFICQVCSGRRKELSIFGGDYDTKDGTSVRDYTHVVDLAQGHVAALSQLEQQCGLKVYNLGAGKGVSVLELVKAMEKASGQKIPYKIVGRRAGDVPEMYSDATLAEKELKWKAKRGLEEMCEDAWRWQSKNPNGYASTCNGHV